MSGKCGRCAVVGCPETDTQEWLILLEVGHPTCSEVVRIETCEDHQPSVLYTGDDP